VNGLRVLVYGLLPGLALLLAMAAGLLKWKDASIRNADIARSQSIVAARDSAIALLSFRSDTVEQEVDAARERLTGGFRDTYTQVTREVLIPNAKERHVTAAASVPAAASESATDNHAVVLLFVDQSVTVDGSPPADAASSVRVTLDKIGERWLVSGFDQF
jgi:Mce-associated membrane protein